MPDGNNADHPSKKHDFTDEEVAEGTALVAEMLKAWTEKKVEDVSPEMLSSTQESVAEDDTNDEPAQAAVNLRMKKEAIMLTECFEEFKPRLEKSRWAMTALLETY